MGHLVAGIPDDTLYRELPLLPDGSETPGEDKGKEDRPHVTVYYGLPDDTSPELVSQVVGEVDLFSVQAVGIDYFRNPDKPYDVAILRVEGQGVRDCNERMRAAFGSPKDFPDYNPHITLAYIKKGAELTVYPRCLWPIAGEFGQLTLTYPDKREFAILRNDHG